MIELSVGELILDGEIRARGTNGGSDRSAGAGGSILIDATRLSGSGLNDATGGLSDANGEPTGPGGGGRVAIYADDIIGFDRWRRSRSVADGARMAARSPDLLLRAPPSVHHGTSLYGDF